MMVQDEIVRAIMASPRVETTSPISDRSRREPPLRSLWAEPGHTGPPEFRLGRTWRARADLADAVPGSGITVTDVAARWGFTHFGRFAVTYRARFGESPKCFARRSMTRRRGGSILPSPRARVRRRRTSGASAPDALPPRATPVGVAAESASSSRSSRSSQSGSSPHPAAARTAPYAPHSVRTHAGDARKPTWKAFVSYLCIDAASAVVPGGPIWVEMGLQWEADITEGLAAVGIVVTRRWMTSYASPPRPAVLLYAGPSLPADFDPSTLRGADLPRACLAVSGRPGGLVLDPCCGKGFTARAAVSNGMVFRGCELNAARLHVTEQWLRKRTVT